MKKNVGIYIMAQLVGASCLFGQSSSKVTDDIYIRDPFIVPEDNWITGAVWVSEVHRYNGR